MKSEKRRKDPEGGLTAEGRRYFAQKEGSHLRPGVRGAADTPEKMRRKGSFLRRHFAHPRGPMKSDQGKPTRLALSAHAWGEPVPTTMAGAKKLAATGKRLLARYAKTKTKKKTSTGKKTKKRQPATSLVENINRRKRAGTSRPKSRSTVSKKSYDRMEAGWPAKKTTKTTRRKKA
ncbi:MAG TPA: DUF6321 domain-containing protein [Polyangiaceae bacterium]|jgi:hypothetical protein|nr:DUF6321 domain-containing protein [Polyangiaceae bacterium]